MAKNKIHFFDGGRIDKGYGGTYVYYKLKCLKTDNNTDKTPLTEIYLHKLQGSISVIADMCQHTVDYQIYLTNDPKQVTCKHCLKKIKNEAKQ